MHEIGGGIYTVMQQVASDALGLSPEKVTEQLGDRRLPPSHPAIGSTTIANASASVLLAAAKAARDKQLTYRSLQRSPMPFIMQRQNGCGTRWRMHMSRFDSYRESFPNARLTRSNSGVLEVALHTNGDTLIFNGYTHEQFVELFHAIGSDRDNRVVILTGSGGAFMESISPDGFDFFSPQGYDKIYREGKKVLMNILDIEVPLIAAVNGPVRLHSEYILLADIVLGTPSTVFQDKPHFEFGIVPGDGVNLLWQEVIGTVRGRYFILTRQELDAKTAKEWGAINEIVPGDKLLPRAREIAEGLAKLPPLTSSYTRIALTQKLRRIIDEAVGYGLALEGISAADVARSMAEKR
jgi:enoyl-CoA hydratase/carnithine racemase